MSTTARMATPRRDHRKNRYRLTADTSATIMTISWLYPTLTSNTVNVSVGRKSGKRMYVPGSPHEVPQSRRMASIPSVSPIMPAIWYCVPTCDSMRVSSSSSRPMIGPSTNRQSTAATRPGDALLHVQPVEDVRRHRGDRAVREVEDARRLVREHEPGAREAVDRAGGEADDDERKKFLHASDSLSAARDDVIR